MKEFKSIAELLKNHRMMSVNKDTPVTASSQQSLLDYWQEQIGIAAPYSYPLLFQSGRLVVFCDSAAWATQLRHQKLSLLRQLNDSHFKVSDIDIKIRPLSSSQLPLKNSLTRNKPISKDSADALCTLADKVGHGGLRESLLRLAKKSNQKTSKEDQ